MPIQTLESNDMPLPAEMPQPNKAGDVEADPETDDAATPDSADAKALKEERDAAAVPAPIITAPQGIDAAPGPNPPLPTRLAPVAIP